MADGQLLSSKKGFSMTPVNARKWVSRSAVEHSAKTLAVECDVTCLYSNAMGNDVIGSPKSTQRRRNFAPQYGKDM